MMRLRKLEELLLILTLALTPNALPIDPEAAPIFEHADSTPADEPDLEITLVDKQTVSPSAAPPELPDPDTDLDPPRPVPTIQ